MNKRSIAIAMVLVFALSAFVVGCGGGADTEDGSGPMFLNITTATTGGTYYPVGVGMATLWTDQLRQTEGISVSSQSSAGSVENVDILRNGEADLAIMQSLIGAYAWSGEGPFEGNPYQDFRSISALWFNVEHFVLESSLVETGTLSDIEGKSFSIGASGSGTERSTLTIMEGLGLTTDDIETERIGYTESAQAMQDGRLDGASLPAGTPVPAVSDLMVSPIDVTILEVTDEQIEGIANVFLAWDRWVIPAGTYENQPEDINTIAQANWLAVNDNVDEEVVYLLTKTLHEEVEFLHGVHAATQYTKLETATVGLPVPLHPGAIRYYEEVGIDVPDRLRP